MNERNDDLFNHVLERITPTITAHTTPILAAYEGKVHQHATGTLVAVAEHRFIVTASHAIKDFVKGQKRYTDIILLVENGSGKLVRLFGEYSATKTARDTSSDRHDPDGDDLDIAVWKLHDATIEALTGKSFLNRRDISISADVTSGVFFLAGYPKEWSSYDSDDPKSIILRPLPFIAAPFEATEEIPTFNSNLHMLLELDPPSPCPEKLQGISGCAVWKLSNEKLSSDWTSEKVKVVGVQTGVFPRSGAIKATKWKHVIRCLTLLVPEIRDAFKLWLPGE